MKKKISIFFLIVFILTIISVVILNTQINRLDGDAISGQERNGKYYIMTSDYSYVEVTKSEWYKDYTIWVISISFWILSGIGILFFFIAYCLPLTFKMAKDCRNVFSKQ